MDKRFACGMLLILILGLTWTSSLNSALSITSKTIENLDRKFTFEVQYGHFPATHTLYVSIPNTLYEYYNCQGHAVISDNNYAKYVTPSVFTSIAESIQKATNNTAYSDEQFANAVLDIVRQIPYNKSDVKYPVETLVENTGDCDVLSILAASIMQAGGLDVVLLHYTDISPSHMNIGVYLPHKPVYRSWWINPVSVEYNNRTYWVAETTSQGQWKVGEKPGLLANSKTYIIPLNSTQRSAPGQISSSLDTPLLPSNISITLSSNNASLTDNKHLLIVSGAITPALPNQTVSMYLIQNNYVQVLEKATTDQNGTYSFNWSLTMISTYQIQTSCSDISNCETSDSDIITAFGSSPPAIYYDSETYGSLAALASILNTGTKEFLKGNVSGTGAALSGEFILLDNNQPEIQNEMVNVPQIEHIFIPGRRFSPPIEIAIPREIPKPVIPTGQVGFMLQQDGDSNYSASVRILGDQDTSQIAAQLNNEADTAFMNASQITRNNTWYKITATLSENGTNSAISEENGTILNNVTPRNDASTTETGVLVTYYPGAVIAFRNLKVETLDKAESQANSTQASDHNAASPMLYGEFIVSVVAVFVLTAAAATLIRKKLRKNRLSDADSVSFSA